MKTDLPVSKSPETSALRRDMAQKPAEEVTPMARRNEELSDKAASTSDELERLRLRQEALEREKQTIEYLRENQHKYETAKREIIERLEQSMVSLEREEISINQRITLLADTEKRFKEMLAELKAIRDDAWPAETGAFREELTKSLALLDDMRKEFNKCLARIEALKDDRSAADGKQSLFEEIPFHEQGEKGFGFWLKIGFALTMPIVLVLLLLAIVTAMRPY